MNNKWKVLGIHILALSLFLCACSTTPPKVYWGAGIGAAAGMAMGHNAGGGSDQSRIVGALLGAGIGSLIAYSANKKSEASTKGLDKSLEETFPNLTKPKLRSIWVPDKIEGNQYIKGHYIYLIEDPGTWSR